MIYLLWYLVAGFVIASLFVKCEVYLYQTSSTKDFISWLILWPIGLITYLFDVALDKYINQYISYLKGK